MKVLQFMPQFPGKDGTSAYCAGLCPELNRLESDSSAVVSLRTDGRDGPENVDVKVYPQQKG